MIFISSFKIEVRCMNNIRVEQVVIWKSPFIFILLSHSLFSPNHQPFNIMWMTIKRNVEFLEHKLLWSSEIYNQQATKKKKKTTFECRKEKNSSRTSCWSVPNFEPYNMKWKWRENCNRCWVIRKVSKLTWNDNFSNPFYGMSVKCAQSYSIRYEHNLLIIELKLEETTFRVF
jgi:hypothetical protein